MFAEDDQLVFLDCVMSGSEGTCTEQATEVTNSEGQDEVS